MNYTITWKYIVERMKSKYGFAPDSTEQLSAGELERYIQGIWEELFEKKYEAETRCEHCPNLVVEDDDSWYCTRYTKYCEDIVEECNYVVGKCDNYSNFTKS